MATRKFTPKSSTPRTPSGKTRRTRPGDKQAAGKLPDTYLRFADRFPDVVAAHQSMIDAARAAGPLDARTC